MPQYSSLHIPKRDRKKGEYIWCGECNTTISDTCKKNGKKKYTCKHPEKQRFQSRAYDSTTRRTIPIKTYPKELRDFYEFDKQHQIEMARFKSEGKTKNIKQSNPTLLQDAIRMYIDWLEDDERLVPSHEVKGYSESHLNNEYANLRSFKESQPNYDLLRVEDVTSAEVGLFHDYLSRFANKTYNNKIHTLKSAFNFFIEKGYKINNPFENVKNKKVAKKSVFIELADFNNLKNLTTKENGVIFEKSNGKIKRKNFFRSWLIDFWELALYSGGRREDVANLRFSDVKKDHFEVISHKTSDEDETVIRWVARTTEFNELFKRLITKYNLSGDDYLIEPQDNRRETIYNHASKAFTKYWRELDPGYKATMYALKDTHITLMIMKYGNSYEGVFGSHASIKTSLEHYANFEKMISQFAHKPMTG